MTPTFAVVGAVNHGKSSVVATLAENDRVRISRMPGETVHTERFALRDLFVFFDTPGFQNAREALAELQAASSTADPSQVFRDFIARHRHDPVFDAECRLLEPLLDGAGLIYVVDGSRELLDIHRAEMEVLRLTGAPRLAIINRTGRDDHVAAWQRQLGMHFNAVREFDAHRARFADRIELLDTLAGIDPTWKPQLKQAVALLTEEWNARIDDVAGWIVDLLGAALTHAERTALSSDAAADPASRERAGARLRQRYTAAISALEAGTHARIIGRFEHGLVTAGDDAAPLFGDDLFSDDTWNLLGLDAKQLMTAGAAAGAVAGAGADALAAGHTLLAGTAIGAAIGTAGAYFVGKKRPELSVDLGGGRVPKPLRGLLGSSVRLSGQDVVVGPYKAANFPWILIDRAIGCTAYVIHRAHARRDRVTLDARRLVGALDAHGLTVSRWSDGERKAAEKAFRALRRGTLDDDARRALVALLAARIRGVAEAKLSFDSAMAGPG